MAGGRQQARDWITEADEPERSFPLWVTLGSLVLALVVFFSGTVPALRERDGLDEVEVHAEELLRRYEAALKVVPIPGQHRQHEDMQSLLVAIDRLGMTPAELLQQFPEPLDTGDDR